MWIIPAELPFSWGDVKSKAAAVGVNPFARQIMMGWFTTQMQRLRLDQVHTLLMNGGFIADIIDDRGIPVHWSRVVRMLGRFIDLNSLSERLDGLLTPRMIYNAVREANPEVFSLIINSPAGGPKWFADQTHYMVGKLKIIIEREIG